MLSPEIRATIERALAEDIDSGDVTTDSIVPETATLDAKIVAKSAGVAAGLAVAETAFLLLDQQVVFSSVVADGDQIQAGQVLAEINGPARAILTAERTALNFVGRMSGIATLTRQFVDEARGTRAKILDTRKTAPNLRPFDKEAVRLGGGENHRLGLFDMILIKDNHIDFAGSITEAVRRARALASGLEVEVEARTLRDVAECLDLAVGWIMLDNMPLDEMREAVRLAHGRAKVEASGNITLANVHSIAETGVDYISVGALTHSVRALDVSLMVNWHK
ncbi:MAG TPA: carboxylating nicotinate-nucleotide diphosphorylase [Pyrinomonadaceae bacterium]|nr:carboxylating nicotinate-nucleotide diphosphorylase [Pyrinomonadaceae bacterium]